jgi:prolyl 4-hydroxylase
MTRTLFPVANIIVIMMPFTMQGCGMLLNVVSALLLLTAMIASHPGRTFFFGSAAEEECTLGLDGACIASDGMNDALAAMKVTASEDGSVFYDTGFGVAQSVAGEKTEDTKKRLIETARYMKNRVLVASADDVLSQVAKECQLRHEHCAFWAVIGECEKNPGMMVSRAFSAEVNGNMTHYVLLLSLPAYMKLQCAPACFTCEQLAFETRCPMPGNFENVWSVGDLNRMFECIATNPYYQSKYNVQVLMRPKNETDGPEDAINDDPWVVVIDNFLTDEECDTLIRLGGEQGYLMSKDVGGKNFDGTYEAKQSSGRTSTNAWCLDKCYEDPVTKTVLAKIENLTGIPDSNAEYLQLLKYEETQFYRESGMMFAFQSIKCPTHFLLFYFRGSP